MFPFPPPTQTEPSVTGECTSTTLCRGYFTLKYAELIKSEADHAELTGEADRRERELRGFTLVYQVVQI